MTTNEIADIIITSLSERSFPVFLTTFSGMGFSEADVFGINNGGYMYEFEIKRSRKDFFADFKNKDHKHKNLAKANAIYVYNEWKNGKRTGNNINRILIPNRFFFVCESGLINPDEVPNYAGLIYVEEKPRCYSEIKSAKLIHRIKADKDIYCRCASILSQRIIYGCSYYTYKHSEAK
jgi:hypothetical protein